MRHKGLQGARAGDTRNLAYTIHLVVKIKQKTFAVKPLILIKRKIKSERQLTITAGRTAKMLSQLSGGEQCTFVDINYGIAKSTCLPMLLIEEKG